MFQAKFKVPTYYLKFHCKGKECRHCCCSGWKVTLTEKEFFQIHSLDCSSPMKEKIDSYVGILPHPTLEEYGRINFNYLGECPLRLENGYCGLQVECGEEKIPSVCRYYPRSPKLYPIPLCSVSDSCEAVLELLCKENYHFGFVFQELSFFFDDEEKKNFPKDYMTKQKECFALLQKEEIPLSERLENLSSFFGEKPLSEDKEKEILLELKKTYSRSFSIMDYLSAIPVGFPSFRETVSRLKEVVPHFEHNVTNILLNHFLYVRFPFVTETEEELPLVGEALLLLCHFWFLLLLFHGSEKESWFIDVTGDFFRLAEHSNFYQAMLFYLKKQGNE